MYNIIKEIANRSVSASLNYNFFVGTVKSNRELVLDQGLVLPIEPCCVLESVRGLKLIVNGVEYVVKCKIKVGDEVLLMQIGNDYCILGRMDDLFAENVVSITV